MTSIVTLSGIPILLFLASIQSIPSHLYEAAKVEGATAYEMFWLIMFPNVTPHILTVLVYVLVDSFLTSSVTQYIQTTINQRETNYIGSHRNVMVYIVIGLVNIKISWGLKT